MKIGIIILIFIFSTSLHAQDFDPIKPDYDLLKQIIVGKFNQKRERKERKQLQNNEALQLTADSYVNVFSENRLEKNTKNKLRIGKKIKKNCKLNGYKNAFIDYHIASINCIDFSGTNFYFDKEDTETSTHLFIGKKPSKKEKEDSKYTPVKIKLYTYNQLADLIIRQFITDEGSFKILNNGFDKFGFSLAVEHHSILKKKMPKIKVIVILGGNRITW